MKIKCPLKRIHRGSDFRDFLKEQSILCEVEARAVKQAMSLKISRELLHLRHQN